MLQVSRSLYQKDKRIFTFILCLDMMIYKQQLDTKDVDILMTEVIRQTANLNRIWDTQTFNNEKDVKEVTTEFYYL